MSQDGSQDGNLWDAMGKVGFQSGMSNHRAAGEDLDRLPDGSSLEGHPYLPFLHRLEKPGRYLGGELHSVRKSSARLSIALAFPDAYEIGMSHLGFRILYSHLNDLPEVRAERVYAPWPDLENELRKRDLPLVSLESWTPLAEFDCVGFSLQYELTFTNILTMLDVGGIPIRSADRSDEDPLVMAGGPVAFQPEPMAPFIDAYLIGDGEGFFADTVATWVRLKQQGVPRHERLRRIAQLDGIYAPALYGTRICERSGLQVVDKPLEAGIPEQVRRAHVPDINAYPFPSRVPVPNTEIVFDRASIEIARGCTEGCRFCQAGMIYRPVRERKPDQIVDAVKESVRCGGFDEVSLTSLSTADYSAVQPLVKAVMAQAKKDKVAISVSSLRAYGLSEEMLDEISSVRNTSLTFAPEAGTQRMRDVINKNISEEDIVTSAHRIFSRGWRKMKLYFMIGLPTETDEDVLGIAETGKRLLAIGGEYLPRHRLNVTVSVSSHVPKPFTPFQWAAMDDVPEIERKQELLRGATRVKGMTLRWHDPGTSHLEGILSRGDRALADVIELAWRKGCRFDGWNDHLRFDLWMESLEEIGIDRWKYLNTLPVDGRVPWDHIDCGVEWRFLKREYQKSLKDRLSTPCGKPAWQLIHHTNLEDALEEKKKLVCYACGVVCDMTRMRDERMESLRDLDAHRKSPEGSTGDGETRQPRVRRERGAGARRPAAPQRDPDSLTCFAYRFRYAKVGAGRFLSHLDLVRLFPRAFRRAGLRLAYSAGYHPLPMLSFGPALRLGVPGLSELVEVRLAEQVPVAGLVERVNAVLPQGIVLRGGHAVEEGAAKLSRLSSWADFLVFLEAEHAMRLEPSDLERLLVGAGLEVPRRKKNGTPYRYDIGPGIAAVELLEALPADCRDFLTLHPEDRLLRLRLGLQGQEMVRPEEALMILFDGRLPSGTRIVRRRLLPAPSRRPQGRSGPSFVNSPG